MARLIIHIGTHKTATSRLQALFAANADLLKRHGLIYPQIGPYAQHHPLVGHWNQVQLPHADFDTLAAWRRLAQDYADQPGTVFLSSEEFSRDRARRVDMAEVLDLTKDFESVNVVMMLRNQASFIQSVYQQISTTRSAGPWSNFFAGAIDNKLVDGLALDYNRIYSNARRGGFPRPNIHCLSYDHARQEPGGVIGVWLRYLNLPLSEADLAQISDSEANISANPLASYAANRLMQGTVPPPALIALIEQALNDYFGPNQRSSVFIPSEIDQLESVFTPDNDTLSERIAPYQADFSVGPMLGYRPSLWRDDLDAGFWQMICRQLHGMVPKSGKIWS